MSYWEEREVRFVNQDRRRSPDPRWRRTEHPADQEGVREERWRESSRAGSIMREQVSGATMEDLEHQRWRESSRSEPMVREQVTGATSEDLEHLITWRWRNQLRNPMFEAPEPAVFNIPYQDLVTHSLLMHLQSLRQMLKIHVEEGLINQRVSDLVKVRELNQDIHWLESCLTSVGLSTRCREEETWMTLQGPLGNKVVRIITLRPE